MKTPKQIIEILHSIKEVKIQDDELMFKSDPVNTTFPDGWEPNAGYVHGSFTHQLLLLIEAGLKGELEE